MILVFKPNLAGSAAFEPYARQLFNCLDDKANPRRDSADMPRARLSARDGRERQHQHDERVGEEPHRADVGYGRARESGAHVQQRGQCAHRVRHRRNRAFQRPADAFTLAAQHRVDDDRG